MTTRAACPVCTQPYTAAERQCPQCGWELEGAYILGPITPEVQASFERDLALCRQAQHLAQAQARIAELEQVQQDKPLPDPIVQPQLSPGTLRVRYRRAQAAFLAENWIEAQRLYYALQTDNPAFSASERLAEIEQRLTETKDWLNDQIYIWRESDWVLKDHPAKQLYSDYLAKIRIALTLNDLANQAREYAEQDDWENVAVTLQRIARRDVAYRHPLVDLPGLKAQADAERRLDQALEKANAADWSSVLRILAGIKQADLAANWLHQRAMSPKNGSVVVVSQQGKGNFTTINEALRHVAPGMRILVCPGIYEEHLLLDKPMQIIGNGPRSDIVIQSIGTSSLHIQASGVLVRGLTFHSRLNQISSSLPSVWINQGLAFLEKCAITSEVGDGILIEGNDARPITILRRCHIAQNRQNGIVVSQGSTAIVDRCDIVANGGHGILHRGDLHVKQCQINHNDGYGIDTHAGCSGLVEDNHLIGNRRQAYNYHTFPHDTTVGHNNILDE